MTKPSFVRRKPKDDTPIEIPQSEQVCPGCIHKYSDHNQFGCCYEGEVCDCLIGIEILEQYSGN